jgi:hypothetical protein
MSNLYIFSIYPAQIPVNPKSKTAMRDSGFWLGGMDDLRTSFQSLRGYSALKIVREW